jgi:hypothetical protein
MILSHEEKCIVYYVFLDAEFNYISRISPSPTPFAPGGVMFYVVMYYVVVCSMLPQYGIIHNDVCIFNDCFNISVTLTRLKCELPDYGHRPKHVGAILT